MPDRLQRLRQRLAEKEIEAIIVSQLENRCYLSGFDGSAGMLLIGQQQSILTTDFRYTEQAGKQAPQYTIQQTSGEVESWLPDLIGQLNIKKLGFETEHITHAMYNRMSKALQKAQPGLKLIPLEGVVESIRKIKEPREIEFIQRAAWLCDAAFEHICQKIKAGLTEKEIAWIIESFLRQHGSEVLPFDVIVASGPNSALPHAKASERIIKPGEPIIMDFGAKVAGYCSDLSRTICLGKADEKFQKVYSVVLEAQLQAIEEITAAMSSQRADGIAREVIAKAGYGDAFGHGLGHGLGLQVHELPFLGPVTKDILENNMVFTIEPAIYLPGWGGVRIEDTTVMDCGKIRVLSQADKTSFKWGLQ